MAFLVSSHLAGSVSTEEERVLALEPTVLHPLVLVGPGACYMLRHLSDPPFLLLWKEDGNRILGCTQEMM